MALTDTEQKSLDTILQTIERVKARIKELEAGVAPGAAPVTDPVTGVTVVKDLNSLNPDDLKVRRDTYAVKIAELESKSPRTPQEERTLNVLKSEIVRTDSRIKELSANPVAASGVNNSDPNLGKNINELNKVEVQGRINYLNSRIATLEAKGELNENELTEIRQYKSILASAQTRLAELEAGAPTSNSNGSVDVIANPALDPGIGVIDLGNLTSYTIAQLNDAVLRYIAISEDLNDSNKRRISAGSAIPIVNAEIQRRYVESGSPKGDVSENYIEDLLKPAVPYGRMTPTQKQEYWVALDNKIKEIRAKNPQRPGDSKDIEGLQSILDSISADMRSEGVGPVVPGNNPENLKPGTAVVNASGTSTATSSGIKVTTTNGGEVVLSKKSSAAVIADAKAHISLYNSSASNYPTVLEQGFVRQLNDWVNKYESTTDQRASAKIVPIVETFTKKLEAAVAVRKGATTRA